MCGETGFYYFSGSKSNIFIMTNLHYFLRHRAVLLAAFNIVIASTLGGCASVQSATREAEERVAESRTIVEQERRASSVLQNDVDAQRKELEQRRLIIQQLERSMEEDRAKVSQQIARLQQVSDAALANLAKEHQGRLAALRLQLDQQRTIANTTQREMYQIEESKQQLESLRAEYRFLQADIADLQTKINTLGY